MRKTSVWDEFENIQDDWDNVFSAFFAPALWTAEKNPKLLGSTGDRKSSYPVRMNYRRPLTDIYETDNSFIASLEMPGVKKEDIQINAADGSLTVKVEKDDKAELKDEKKGLYCSERRHAGFYRRFSLPENTKIDKIGADLKDGVLKLTIPKTEKAKTKQIDIKVK